jgi:ribonuclease BN (tRNA processing enzyme)
MKAARSSRARLVPVLLCTAVALAATLGPPSAAYAAASKPPVELLVLGSGGPGAVGRAASAYVLSIGGTPRILIDAGPGSFARLGEAHLDLDALDVVLLTHLHADHAAELPGIVKARAVSTGHPIPFEVFGPIGHPAHDDVPAFPSTRRFIDLLFGSDGAFAYLKDFAAPVTFTVVEVPGPAARRAAPAAPAAHPARPEQIYHQDGVLITALPGHHGDAPSVVYRIEVQGRGIAFSGDIDASGLPALESLARGVDLLVFNSVVLDPPASPEILYTLHTPPSAIGEVAAHDHVGSLLLSHLSPAVDAHRDEVTASIARHYHGPITFASDGMRIPLASAR